MSEELVSAAAPEVQAEAQKMGWMPPERYKGDPERYVDADEYLQRGQTILPIVKEQNKRLQAELAEVRRVAETNGAALKAAQDAIEQIEIRHSVATQKAVEAARADLKKQLAAASADGDHEGVAELTDQLTKLNVAEEKAEEKKAAPPPPFVPPADLQAWNAENPWFGQDKRKTALALGIAQELREGGDTSTGRAFFDKVTAEMEAMLPTAREPISKVEGARGGAEGETRAKGTYSALPKDARDACDADARQFVGPTKRYKTLAEWRTRYAEIYFEGR